MQTNDTKLLQKLQSLAVRGLAQSANGSAVLSSIGGEYAVERILRLIDSTIMSRLLTFSCDSLTLSITVANRRIVSVDDSTSGDLIADPSSALQDEGASAEVIAQAIVNLCSFDQPVLVQSTTPAKAVSPQSRDGAVSITRLTETLEFDLWPEAGDSFLKFVDAVETYFLTSLMMKEDEVLGEFGDEERIDQMRNDYTTILENAGAHDDSLWEPHIQVQVSADDNTAVISASAATYFLGIEIDADHVGDVMAAWDQSYG